MKIKDYFPIENSGQTLKKRGKTDPCSIYSSKASYNISQVGIFTVFKNRDKIKQMYGEYILLMVNGEIDYLVLTSLN